MYLVLIGGHYSCLGSIYQLELLSVPSVPVDELFALPEIVQMPNNARIVTDSILDSIVMSALGFVVLQ